ncbi:MAG: hypothetical protein A2Z72_06920 [Omnitrophica bacterium RBG_13_46_9]|nr:MAG: hypothetical protein A2Z72_06920 [Omnitrophica bacterium RBG_13_46_9]
MSGEEIGNRIKKIRKTKKITQSELAKNTGILRANISRLEKGKHSPNLETLEKIADALGIPVSNLVAK